MKSLFAVAFTLVCLAPNFAFASVIAGHSRAVRCERLFGKSIDLDAELSQIWAEARAMAVDPVKEKQYLAEQAEIAAKIRAAHDARAYALTQARMKELDRVYAAKQARIRGELDQVTSIEGWAKLSKESKLAVIRDNEPMKLGAVSENQKSGLEYIPLLKMKDPTQVRYAKKMIEFMNASVDLEPQEAERALLGNLKIGVEVVTTSDGQIIGGVVFAKQQIVDVSRIPSSRRLERYPSLRKAKAAGAEAGTENYRTWLYFDENGRVLHFSTDMEYDH